MYLEILTPEKKVFEGNVVIATFPGSDGSFQVLDNHAPLISLLKEGKVEYKSKDATNSLMITGGKLGQILGRKRAFAIGCVIYGCGSLTTALAPNLAVLMLGWSVLERIGAALIMPAIFALVASNFGPSNKRSWTS